MYVGEPGEGLGTFTAYVDSSRSLFAIRAGDHDQASMLRFALEDSAENKTPSRHSLLDDIDVDQNGTPDDGVADTVEVVTVSLGSGEAGCGRDNSFCGEVRLRSFFDDEIRGAHIEITSMTPATGNEAFGDTEDAYGHSSTLGLWSYGTIGAQGSATRMWKFNDTTGTAYRFRGRVVGQVEAVTNDSENTVVTETPGQSQFDGTPTTTNQTLNLTMGHRFTMNAAGTATKLGGYFNGTKTVYLFDHSSTALLAMASHTSANSFTYSTISGVSLSSGSTYVVAVYLAGGGGASDDGKTTGTTYGNVTIDCPGTGGIGTNMPVSCTTEYVGMADVTIAFGASDPCSDTVDNDSDGDVDCADPDCSDDPGCVGNEICGNGLDDDNDGDVDCDDLECTGTATTETPGQSQFDGTASTIDQAGNYTSGYRFTANANGTANRLGGYYNGTKTVYLFDYNTAAVLAAVSHTSANSFTYSPIMGVTLTSGTTYVVAVNLAGSGGASDSGKTNGLTYGNATVDCPGTRGTSGATMPVNCLSTYFGMADVSIDFIAEDETYCMIPATVYETPGQSQYDGSPTLIDQASNYTMGHRFTVEADGTAKQLGGYYNGTKTVYLYEYPSGTVLASVSHTSENSFSYSDIADVALSSGSTYVVGVWLANRGGARDTGKNSGVLYDHVTIDCPGTALSGSAGMPTSCVTSYYLGMADVAIEFANVPVGERPGKSQFDGSPETIDGATTQSWGYRFTVNADGTANQLGGYYNGTKSVYLFDHSTTSLLASVSHTSANAFTYSTIPDVALTSGSKYVVAVDLAGSGGAVDTGKTVNQTYGNVTIDCPGARGSGATMPATCESNLYFGMADVSILF